MENEGLIIDELLIDQNGEDFRTQFGKDASQRLMNSLVLDFQDDYSDGSTRSKLYESELMQSGQTAAASFPRLWCTTP